LRLWRDDPHAITVNDRTAEAEIVRLLEWYICECLWYCPSGLEDWWSDGVIYLVIRRTSEGNFKLLGVTWIDCHGLAPFEIDVELNAADDHHFAKTTFRIGALDDDRRPKLFDCRIHAPTVLDKRPRKDRDWAMAVELTPPAQDANIAGAD
jgi:hypothetical protein